MSANPIQEWTCDGVLDELSRIDKTMRDRQFAFILGAGASVTSRIPSGKELAERWLKDLHLRECADESALEDWVTGPALGISGLSFRSAATHYPQIFERRFRGDREAGYAELENAMEGKTPSLGYSLLAEIIQRTRHKVVVTTNFDNLVADALAMHAHQSPLVVAHESLAGFVRPQLRRPLVAKIHRDLFLNPKNDKVGVSTMEESWKIALRRLFQYFTPIVIGYGGNDGSLMGLLASLNQGDIAGRLVWCYREGASLPDAANEVIRKHEGVKVQIPGFDEFMLLLAAKLVPEFDVAGIADRTEKLGKERATRYREQAAELQKSSERGTPAQRRTGVVMTESVQSGKSAWSWLFQAAGENDLSKRDQIYKQGLEQFPASAELASAYAAFLTESLKNHDAAEAWYKKALELDPSNANSAGNYAVLLAVIRRNYDAADAQYKKALELDPDDADIAGNYAAFLAENRKDYDAAEAQYKKALKLDPNHVRNMQNFAAFLAYDRKEYDAAEVQYKRALELDPTATDIATDYATFLTFARKDYGAAESLYKKALQIDPSDPDMLANYVMLLLSRNESESIDAIPKLVQTVIDLSGSDSLQATAEALLYASLHAELNKGTPAPWLARVKSVLRKGFERSEWDFSAVFDSVLPNIPKQRSEFYRALGSAILDASRVQDLDAYETWRDLAPVDWRTPLEIPETAAP
jgi:Tfp pilus assembly protein PilF